MKPLLIVMDMQNGFCNSNSAHIVPRVKYLVRAFKDEGKPVAFTRFINRPDSGFVRWIHWPRFMQSPEIDLIPGLAGTSDLVFDKSVYTAFSEAFEEFVANQGIDLIAICGVATDSCVLKTAVDAFERGIEPIVFSDACANHKSPEIHEAGLLILGRFIGRDQIRSCESVHTLLRPNGKGFPDDNQALFDSGGVSKST